MDLRKKMAIKNMRFNRFIFLRYSLALFFFTNLNWFIFMLPSGNAAIMIPLLMIIGAIFPIKEFLKVYDVKQKIRLNDTKKYFAGQLILNLLLIVSALNAQLFSFVFPFMNINMYGIIGMTSVLSLGILISLTGLKKINVLREDKDKGYKLYMDFKKSLKVSETHGE